MTLLKDDHKHIYFINDMYHLDSKQQSHREEFIKHDVLSWNNSLQVSK